MNDQERMTDFLCSEKKMTSNYDTYASECVNIPLRDAFLGLFNQGHHTQTELFQLAQSKAGTSPSRPRRTRSARLTPSSPIRSPQDSSKTGAQPAPGPKCGGPARALFPGREKELGKKAGIH